MSGVHTKITRHAEEALGAKQGEESACSGKTGSGVPWVSEPAGKGVKAVTVTLFLILKSDNTRL